jgi:hypothetical protein
VSVVLIMALLPSVVGTALLTFVTVVAILTRDKDRSKTAVAVLKTLALSRRQSPGAADSRAASETHE